MNAQELLDQMSRAPKTSAVALDRLAMRVAIAGNVIPAYIDYLEDASTYREFFNAIYADESQKDTSVWAEWAKLERLDWIERFEPKLSLRGLRIKTDGLPIEFGTGVVLAPTGSRDRVCNLYVFASGAFNTEAADFVTSVGGKFTCAGYDFAGVYGVYKYRGSVILEEWETEGDPTPSK